jgi:hypothetical protein
MNLLTGYRSRLSGCALRQVRSRCTKRLDAVPLILPRLPGLVKDGA